MTAEQMEALLVEHAPWSQAGRATCGCGITPMRDRNLPFHRWWARHMAGVLAAALSPAGTVEWGVEYIKYGNGVVTAYSNEANARAHAAEAPQYRRVVKRTGTPWQPAD